MPQCLVGLGANLGSPDEQLRQAIARLDATPGYRLVRASSLYHTEAAGGPADQPTYTNGAIILQTDHPPQEVLNLLHSIENASGRKRTVRWGARHLDADLLLYDQQRITTRSLTLPHPRMLWRWFVLAPAAEIAPDWRHPQTGWSLQSHLDHLRMAAPWILLDGDDQLPIESIARQLTDRWQIDLVSVPIPDSDDRTGSYPQQVVEYHRAAWKNHCRSVPTVSLCLSARGNTDSPDDRPPRKLGRPLAIPTKPEKKIPLVHQDEPRNAAESRPRGLIWLDASGTLQPSIIEEYVPCFPVAWKSSVQAVEEICAILVASRPSP